jgi:hypothetical protein
MVIFNFCILRSYFEYDTDFTCMGRSFCTEKTGFGISEFLSFCDVAFCTTFRGHGNVGPNHIDVTWYSGQR